MTSIWKWESGNLQIKKSLLDGLQITETAKEVISVVGAGGKTTTIRRLTDEMEKRQKNAAAPRLHRHFSSHRRFLHTAPVHKSL